MIVPVWAGEAIDLISDLPSAADLVALIVRQAEEASDGRESADGCPATLKWKFCGAFRPDRTYRLTNTDSALSGGFRDNVAL